MCGVDAAHLETGVAFACERIERGARVLVHCQHGIGRSAVLGLCIMVRRGHEPLQALGLMKDRRALVSPSPDQFECWRAWLERHRRTHDVDWSPPGFEEFAQIAYRHLARSA
jgi:protein-tyrosine phosphatase